MKHQPFDEWIFETNKLTEEQNRMLQEHLAYCVTCRRLQESWDGMEHLINQYPQASPSPGFSQRWKTSLGARREISQRGQAWGTFVALSSLAILTLFALAFQSLLIISPVDWLMETMQNSLHFFADSMKLMQTIAAWVQILPLTILLPAGTLFIGLFCILSVLWFYMLNMPKRGIKNETCK